MASLLNTHVDKVDWDAEIEVQLGNKPNLPRVRRDVGNGLTIALTGGTGPLGQCFLQQLVSDPQVKKIICLVRTVGDRDLQNLSPFNSQKTQIEEADLPSLPPDDILSEADCILHCAADQNFWDGYHALRPTNFDAAKVLAHVTVRTDFTNLSGTIDIARLQDVAVAIARSITSRDYSDTVDMTVIDYPGSERISIESLASLYDALLQHSENQSVAKLPTKSVLF
ncbi:synthetase [Pyrenophora tritici-repentis]|uniref:Thioester reductase (TE) domain-containing protein n=1 Tax=Pyrenophora tritici-repentis (strain Pt-1C-BFP) TaxID=426418 RepID=B2W260_PYRTR|nr:uncharacterized protein PTRG_03508 [Pyrenophora tritici-repentis Pt-1C-BFP]KAI0586450.1 synthetase [Pyrenophora tritici-repentis]EDU46346.1 predicted protein [Pyrenophora tritici-repentis Pt-1C-BFP]KAI0604338.1 synthetase [Pyrenophora tritici-repentis]PWO19667.1 serThr protein phosphatase family protein [Pyrenophora tritici-repentis]PZD41554.1 equisetin synthetase [Pyrenophora tritici-repentis]